MKIKPFKMSVIILLFGLGISTAEARFVTLIATCCPSSPPDEITIATNEVAEIVSFFDASANPDSLSWGGGTVQIQKGSQVMYVNAQQLVPNHPGARGKLIIAGPVVIRFNLGGSSGPFAFLTVEITEQKPEPFPPDKTLVIPQGSGALVQFQCSTNLVDWTNVWSGAYTNVPSNKFFRICAQRIP